MEAALRHDYMISEDFYPSFNNAIYKYLSNSLSFENAST